MTIKLRPGVKFHDGEPLDAEAAKFSIERHMTLPTSFRKSELASVDHVEVVDPLTIKLVLEDALLAIDRPAHRSRRHDGLAQGGQGGRRQVRAASGLRGSLQIRRAGAAGTAWCSRKFADYWNKDNVFIDRIVFLPIVDATVRLANLKSGGLDLIERVLATDIKDVRADPKLVLGDRRPNSAISASPSTSPTDKAKGRAQPVREGAPGASNSRSDREAPQPGRLQRRVHARQPMGQPDASLLSNVVSDSEAGMSPRPRRC